ncbi:type IV pilus biogenesis protein PilP [Gluconobacter kondonii]|uniref:type IV pilus biogenesis protein PilP n=1 Tax=Gluconobacter kondonii TaxID=941463 RepID=UPI001B8BC4C8|nr:type IV pilus biogenesis protein PilP [Gluconobacter kondonii]MBS1057435.1 type IV pilus biogenesis protein PilP [Gluconobacter kondonii]
MKHLITAAIVFTLPGLAHAAALDCAKHLNEPAAGEVLSMAQIDQNNACLTYLQQAKAASDLTTAIAANERKQNEKQGQAPRAALDTMQGPPLSPPPREAPNEDHPIPRSVTKPPTYDALLVDPYNHTASAILRFADGSTSEVSKGVTLPDGSVVLAVTSSGVQISSNGIRSRLNATGSQPSGTQIIAIPGASNTLPPPTYTR